MYVLVQPVSKLCQRKWPCDLVLISSVTSLHAPQKWPQDNWREFYIWTLFLVSVAPPSALARPKPYQGVRVRDPVKELLRRKRSLGTAPPPVVRSPQCDVHVCTLIHTVKIPYTVFEEMSTYTTCEVCHIHTWTCTLLSTHPHTHEASSHKISPHNDNGSKSLSITYTLSVCCYNNQPRWQVALKNKQDNKKTPKKQKWV